MAGFDEMFDARTEIENFTEQRIRKLLEEPMNSFQEPNWVQAAILFEDVAIPCNKVYFNEDMYKLANAIVNRAKENGCEVVYIINPEVYDLNREITSSDDFDIASHKSTIRKILNWMQNCKDFLKVWR